MTAGSKRERPFLRRNASLAALFFPGVVFAVGMLLLARVDRFAWLRAPGTLPWEIWAIGGFGLVATLAGVLDHRLHLRLGAKVGPKERRVELAALVLGGIPLFVLMAIATWTHSSALLLPVIAQTLVTATLVVYDEVRFHAHRCGMYETVLHRVLVLGQAGALLAWIHLSFVSAL
ncbi:hypothetical protein BH09MYX1_BH09MYX1_08010 [soil metagenome]